MSDPRAKTSTGRSDDVVVDHSPLFRYSRSSGALPMSLDTDSPTIPGGTLEYLLRGGMKRSECKNPRIYTIKHVRVQSPPESTRRVTIILEALRLRKYFVLVIRCSTVNTNTRTPSGPFFCLLQNSFSLSVFSSHLPFQQTG